MFITGPEVIKEVTQEEIDLNSLGGADVHHSTSGVVHFKAVARMRYLIRFDPY